MNFQYYFAFWIIFLSLNISISHAQITHYEHLDHVMCEMPAMKGKTPISIPYKFKTRPEERNLNFTVDYLNTGNVFGYECVEWDMSAENSFNYALSIWSAELQNDLNIKVQACWSEDLPNGTLGSAGASGYTGLSVGELGFTYFPDPLAEHLYNQEIGTGGAQDVDIKAVFNANRTDWYFGTDANPAFTEYDFVSVVLHEIGHGLGFSGSSNLDDGNSDNGVECDGINGHGCVGLGTNDWPVMYDRFIDDSNGTPIIDLTNNSAEIGNALTSSGLKFDNSNSSIFRSEMAIYSPNSYNGGSSYSHFDESTYPSELMSPFITNGQAIHSPGLATDVMIEMGWSSVILPVEWLDFQLYKYSQQINVYWSTSKEFLSDYFIVERSIDGTNFEEIARVKSAGISNEIAEYQFLDRSFRYGTIYYRIKQVDFNGKVDYTEIQTINFEREIGRPIISPNPVSNLLTIYLDSSEEDISIIIYNMSGNLVKEIKWTNNFRIEINVSDLTPGSYFIRTLSGTKIFQEKFIKS